MWKKVWLALGSVILSGGLAVANPFAQQTCQQALPSERQCVEVPSGASWEWLVPDSDYRNMIQRYNRQNTGLRAGQLLVIPPSYVRWNDLAPFAQTGYYDQLDVIVFDPRRLAWAHYLNGHVRARVGKTGYGYFTPQQLLYSQVNVQFVVLPYDVSSGSS